MRDQSYKVLKGVAQCYKCQLIHTHFVLFLVFQYIIQTVQTDFHYIVTFPLTMNTKHTYHILDRVSWGEQLRSGNLNLSSNRIVDTGAQQRRRIDHRRRTLFEQLRFRLEIVRILLNWRPVLERRRFVSRFHVESENVFFKLYFKYNSQFAILIEFTIYDPQLQLFFT